MITQEQFDELFEAKEAIDTALQTIKEIVKAEDKSLYERWYAYGLQVSDDFVSECTLQDVIDTMENHVSDEESDCENEDCQ